jgi:hypothetical protein
MASTKRVLPGNLALEDLLEAINNPQEHTSPESPINEDASVYGFLITYGIKSGESTIKSRLLYELYKCWTKTPLTKTQFEKHVTKYLINSSRSGQTVYLIDKDAFKIGEEIQKFLIPNNKTKSKSYKKHFETYLTKYNIKPGTYWLESYILYFLYDKWIYSIKKKAPLGEKQFFNFCKLYFKYKRNDSSRVMWFGLDKESLMKTVTEDQLRRIRKGRRFLYGKKQKKYKKISSY